MTVVVFLRLFRDFVVQRTRRVYRLLGVFVRFYRGFLLNGTTGTDVFYVRARVDGVVRFARCAGLQRLNGTYRRSRARRPITVL